MWFVTKGKYDRLLTECATLKVELEMAALRFNTLVEKHKEDLADYKDLVAQNDGLRLRIMSLEATLTEAQRQLTVHKKP